MTREEAIKYLNTLYMALAVFPNQQISLGNVDKMKESVSIAIEALEQEPILDKIRAEIEQEPYVSKMEVLDIIDEYKAESEVEDSDNLDSMLEDLWNATEEDHRKYSEV